MDNHVPTRHHHRLTVKESSTKKWFTYFGVVGQWVSINSQVLQAFVNTLSNLPERDDKALFMKTSHTQDTEHRDLKLYWSRSFILIA